MVSNPLKNTNLLGRLFPTQYGELKHVPNHQPEMAPQENILPIELNQIASPRCSDQSLVSDHPTQESPAACRPNKHRFHWNYQVLAA